MTTLLHRLRSLLPLLLITVLWGLLFGGFKFFIKNVGASPLGLSLDSALEQAVLWMSVGSFVAFVVGGIVCTRYPKHIVILRDAVMAAALISLYVLLVPGSYTLFVLVCAAVGLFYSIYAIARSSLLYLEIQRTQLADTQVNGMVTALSLGSLIAGAFVSTWLFERIGAQALWVILLCLCVIAVSACFLYKDGTQHKSLRGHIQFQLSSWHIILRRLHMLLLPSACVWAVGTIVTVRSIPFAQMQFGISESTSSLIMLFSALGAFAGNALTMMVSQRRWLIARLCLYGFAILVASFSVFTQSFAMTFGYACVLGIFMGAATNIIDAGYIQQVGQMDRKEAGVALQGIAINACLGALMGISTLFSDEHSFLFLGVVTILTGVYARLLSNRT